MNHRILTSTICAIFAISAVAQSETTDSIKTQELDEVVVEASNQRIVGVFLWSCGAPTARAG